MPSFVTESVAAENTFTDWISPKSQKRSGSDRKGFLDLVISGTWSGTVTVQKRYGHGSGSESDRTYTDPFDVVSYTANTVKLIEDSSDAVQYRVGIKTGNYTSGTAAVRLDQ